MTPGSSADSVADGRFEAAVVTLRKADIIKRIKQDGSQLDKNEKDEAVMNEAGETQEAPADKLTIEEMFTELDGIDQTSGER